MLANRSIPASTVIPELPYSNVGDAVDWLCRAFGFTLRLRIGDHRAQLNVGDGAIVVTERQPAAGDESSDTASRRPGPSHAVLVRVDEANSLFERAARCGAKILRAPADYPYGERQFTVEDPGGHVWTFSQSIADVAPEEWGGTTSRSPS